MNEFYRKYRPKKFSDVIGQPAAVSTLQRFLDTGRMPHAVMFHGPSGTGKTTLARIVAKALGAFAEWADIDRALDYEEKNCASFRGIDEIRDIGARMAFAPVGGKARVWVLDEVHQLTAAAQGAALKMLEDMPAHVYFFLCTTDPGRLKRAIVTRCSLIDLKPVKDTDICAIMRNICERAKLPAPDDSILKAIAAVADGSPRFALQTLDKVVQHKTQEEQLATVTEEGGKATGKEIARALLEPKPAWTKIAELIKNCDEDWNQVRLGVLGYVSAVMLNKQKPGREHMIITAFIDPFYEMPKTAFIRAAYEVCESAK